MPNGVPRRVLATRGAEPTFNKVFYRTPEGTHKERLVSSVVVHLKACYNGVKSDKISIFLKSEPAHLLRSFIYSQSPKPHKVTHIIQYSRYRLQFLVIGKTLGGC